MHMSKVALIWLASLSCAAVMAADAVTVQRFHVTLRNRVPDQDAFQVVHKTEVWDPKQTAIIICDMWDQHHCLNAVIREKELAPRMNELVIKLRREGALVIHAPSGCMVAYKDHSGRKLAQSALRAANLPADIGSWCSKIPAEEKGKYPLDQFDGGCDTEPAARAKHLAALKQQGRNPNAPWQKEIDVLKIEPGDAITDSGVEIWNLLEQRGIKNILLVGVHTNMCVLGRPFGLRQLASHGKHVTLVRDMTDTMYNPARWPYVSHFQGTARIIEHIEKYVCPTISSEQILGGEPFRFKDDVAR
jgi:nicotinamidase-related amidase